LLGKFVTINATFDLGPLNPGGKVIQAKPLRVRL